MSLRGNFSDRRRVMTFFFFFLGHRSYFFQDQRSLSPKYCPKFDRSPKKKKKERKKVITFLRSEELPLSDKEFYLSNVVCDQGSPNLKPHAALGTIGHICNVAPSHVALSTIAHICKLAPRSPRV